MYILALETATVPASFTLAHQDQVIQSYRDAPGERAAETLLTRIHEALRSNRLTARDLNVVGLTIGPGSFTGLRCGVAIAKILGYTIDCRIVPLDTMQVIAAGLQPQSSIVRVLMDAQRNGLYWQQFSLHDAQPPIPLQPVQISAVAELRSQLQPAERIVGSGPDKLFASITPADGPDGVLLAEPRSEVVATLTRWHAEHNQFHDPWTLAPHYVGQSAAEEKAPAEHW